MHACSVVQLCPDSLRPHGRQPPRFLCPWNFPEKNTGVGCCFLIQRMFLTQGWNPCMSPASPEPAGRLIPSSLSCLGSLYTDRQTHTHMHTYTHVCVLSRPAASNSLWPVDCCPPGSSIRGIPQVRILQWGCHFLLQGIFPTQGSNPGLLHCRWVLYHLNQQGSHTHTRTHTHTHTHPWITVLHSWN